LETTDGKPTEMLNARQIQFLVQLEY